MTPPEDDEPAAEDLDYGVPPDHGVLRQVKTEFARWHHPRKQYVRVQQWCAATRQLVKDLGLGEGSRFNYLSLPGNELLDVRALDGVCQPAGVSLRYVGFNSVQPGSSDQAELNVSRSEVRALSSVDKFSVVVEDRLESLANTRSTGYRRARQAAPFHAINIDLCDSITVRDINDPRGSILGVLAALLQLQLQTTSPWLLFITTLARPGLVSERSHQGFSSALSANTAASPEFKAELAKLISGNVDQLDAELDRAWKGQNPDFLRLFCAGLGKWLLRILSDAAPPRELVLLNSYYYQVGPDGPDMLSLAFRCNTPPAAVSDRDGILEAGPPSSPFSEVELALGLARQLAASGDLDQMLQDDEELAEKLIGQAGKLLESARFDRTAYETWARGELLKRKAAG